VTDAAAFLASLSRDGQVPWRYPVAGRGLLHSHTGRENHDHGRRRARSDQKNVSYLLSQIPGFQFVGAVPGPAEFDFDCGPGSLRMMPESWLAIREEQLAAVRQRDADTLVTISHACQREWCDIADSGLAVRNYISLVAKAIGCERTYETDSLGRLKRSGDLNAIVDSTKSAWTSHGLSKEEASDLTRKYSWSTKAPRSSAP
jgi:hypothetical protein